MVACNVVPAIPHVKMILRLMKKRKLPQSVHITATIQQRRML